MMTVIAGCVSDGVVCIGGDSAGVCEWDLTIRSDPKVFQIGEMLIGFTTSFRMGQCLMSWSPPEDREDDAYKYMIGAFIDGARSRMKESGFSQINNNVEKGGQFLVGYRNRLFMVGHDFQVGESQSNMLAVGCGGSIALGAMAALIDLRAEERVTRALEIVESLSAGVRGPFRVVRAPTGRNKRVAA